MGINELYRDYLGQRLKNPMAWGAVLPNNVVSLNVWMEEISNGRVYVFNDKPALTKRGSINPNWSERKAHISMIKSGINCVGVLITNGDKSSDDEWHIHGVNEDSIFRLTDLTQAEEGHWYMKIDLTNPIPIEKTTFDIDLAVEMLSKKYKKAFITVEKASERFGWELCGLNSTHATLKRGVELMLVNLMTGCYERKKV